jgi:hypothetical protein
MMGLVAGGPPGPGGWWGRMPHGQGPGPVQKITREWGGGGRGRPGLLFAALGVALGQQPTAGTAIKAPRPCRSIYCILHQILLGMTDTPPFEILPSAGISFVQASALMWYGLPKWFDCWKIWYEVCR